MKERFDDPKFYSHVFYPKSTWKMVAPFVIVPLIALGALFLQEFLDPKRQTTLMFKFTIIGVGTVLLSVPLMIFRLWQLKKVQLAVGSGGVYIRGYGMLPWSEIKTIQMWRHAQRGKCIRIITYSPIERGAESSRGEEVKRLFTRIFEINPNEMFIFSDEFISVPMQELASLLQKYHSEYSQDDRSFDFKGSALVLKSELPKRLSVRSKLFLYLGLMAVIIPVSLAVVLIMQKEMFAFYSTVISSAFIIPMALFRGLRFLAVIVLSSAVMGVAIWAFFSTSMGRGKIDWSLLGLIAFCLVLIFWAVWMWMKEKRAGVIKSVKKR